MIPRPALIVTAGITDVLVAGFQEVEEGLEVDLANVNPFVGHFLEIVIAILRVAFFAEVVLAIYVSLQKSDTNSTLAVPGHCDLSSKQFGSNIGKPWSSAFQTVGGV